MDLKDYPSKIAALSKKVADIDAIISELKLTIAKCETAADADIAWAIELKNDNQRKVRRFEILNANEEYQRVIKVVGNSAYIKASLIADLEQCRNEFSVAKLEVRLAIAQSLTGVESREIAGV